MLPIGSIESVIIIKGCFVHVERESRSFGSQIYRITGILNILLHFAVTCVGTQ